MIDRDELKKSRFFIFFLGACVALAPLSIDMYMPAMSQMAASLQVDFAAVNLTLSAYLFGNAMGQFFGGSLSDQLGRRTIGMTGLALFAIASLLICMTTSITTLQILRVVQAIGGGFATVVCIAQIRDLFPAEEVMKRYADVIVVMMIAPIVAPTIGVLLVPFGWQAIFAVLTIASSVMLLGYLWVIPETKLVIANRLSSRKMFSDYWKVVTHRVDGRITAIRYALYTGFSTGVFMCILTNVAMIFMHHYRFTELQFALGFASLGVAMIIGNRLAVRMSAVMPPEAWLRRATTLHIFMASTLVLLSAYDLLNSALTAVLIFITVVMNGSITPTVSARFINFFDEEAGSAASLSTTISFGFGAIIGAIAALLSKHSLTPVFGTMLVSALIAFFILLSIRDSKPISNLGT